MTFLPALSPARRWATAAFVLLLVLVVWGSLIRFEQSGPSQIDKLEHFGAYAALTALGFAARGRRSWLMVTGLAALGAGVEALQAVLPTGRTGSFWDLLANVAGALAVWLVWTAVVRFRPPAPARGEPGSEGSRVGGHPLEPGPG